MSRKIVKIGENALFLAMFSKAFSVKVIKIWDCVVKD